MTIGLVPPSAGEASVRIGRQEIFDVDGKVVAHELLFRGKSADSAGLFDQAFGADHRPGTARRPDAHDQATSQVIAATFGDFGVQVLGRGKPLFINLTRPFLVGDFPLPFGPQGVVLEVLEHVKVDDALIAGLRRLRDQGFTLAADDFVGEPGRWALLPLVDVVKVDLLGLKMPLAELVAAVLAANPDVTLLAERVEDPDDLPGLHAAGFTMFQGYAFARPALLETTRMSPSQLVCLRLMRVLADPTSSTADLERVVAADPGLSLRVLRTANSAGSGTTSQVSSLRQAVVLLGRVALSAWVTLTLMGGLGSGRREDLVTRAHPRRRLRRAGRPPTGRRPVGGLHRGDARGDRARDGSGPGAGCRWCRHGRRHDPAIAHGAGRWVDRAGRRLLRARGRQGLDETGTAPFDVSRAYLLALSNAMSVVEGVLGAET